MQVHVQRASQTKLLLKESAEYNLIKCMPVVDVLCERINVSL